MPETDIAAAPRIERLDGRAHVPELVVTFCRAFADDPHFNWLIRQDAGRERALAALFELLLTEMAEAGGQVLATPDLKGGLIAYPPGAGKLDWPAQWRFLRRYLGIAGAGRLASRGIGLNLMEARHPREPHFLLQVLGVDPDCRGQGYGRALLDALIAESEAAGVPLYVETGNPDNLGFYGRFGFRVRADHRLPGGLRLWTLLRPPARVPGPG